MLAPGSLLYLGAALVANHPDFEMLGAHTHPTYIPMIMLLAANTPLFLEYALCLVPSFRPALPSNVGFTLHRCTELFMVLLGESVLQLIVSQMPTAGADMLPAEEERLQARFEAMQAAGFGITLTVMHSYTVPEPPAEQHILTKGQGTEAKPEFAAAASFWLIAFTVKSLNVWLVGIGIKIALYDPAAPGDAFYSHDMRALIGYSSAIVYGIGFVMTPLHTSFRAYYVGTWKQPIFRVVEASIVTMMILVVNLPVGAFEYLMVQVALQFAFMVCTQVEHVWTDAISQCRRGTKDATKSLNMH